MGFNRALSKLSEADFRFAMANGKRRSVLLDHDFESLIYCRWKFLKETLPELIKIGNFEKLVLEIFRDRDIHLFPPDVDRLHPNDVLSFILWIKDEIENINKSEQQYLSGEPDADLNAAGINELSMFGDYSSIREIACNFSITPKEVMQWQYKDVFDEQLFMVISSRIEKKLAKIKSKTKGK